MMLPARPPTPLHILYGSQTGCAQEVAERLHREAERRFFAPRTMAMDDYDIRALAEEPLVIFVVATTGEGDPPDNMRSFWRFLLRKGLPRDSLTSLSFAVFGLGDSSYEKFNAAARRLDVRLEQLGARRFLAIGGADDQSPKGMEADVDEWCTRMWATLLLSHGLPAGYKVDDRPRMPILGYALREVSVAAAVEAEPEAATSRPGSDRSGSTPGTAAAVAAAARPPSACMPTCARSCCHSFRSCRSLVLRSPVGRLRPWVSGLRPLASRLAPRPLLCPRIFPKENTRPVFSSLSVHAPAFHSHSPSALHRCSPHSLHVVSLILKVHATPCVSCHWEFATLSLLLLNGLC